VVLYLVIELAMLIVSPLWIFGVAVLVVLAMGFVCNVMANFIIWFFEIDVNFWSPPVGARVDPRDCVPTYELFRRKIRDTIDSVAIRLYMWRHPREAWIIRILRRFGIATSVESLKFISLMMAPVFSATFTYLLYLAYRQHIKKEKLARSKKQRLAVDGGCESDIPESSIVEDTTLSVLGALKVAALMSGATALGFIINYSEAIKIMATSIYNILAVPVSNDRRHWFEVLKAAVGSDVDANLIRQTLVELDLILMMIMFSLDS
jgi:hypothetical protein